MGPYPTYIQVYGKGDTMDVDRMIDMLQALEKFVAVKDFNDGSAFKVLIHTLQYIYSLVYSMSLSVCDCRKAGVMGCMYALCAAYP